MEKFIELYLNEGLDVEENRIESIDSFQFVCLIAAIEDEYEVVVPDELFELEIVKDIPRFYELICGLKEAK